jgi:dolichol kinase
MALSGLTFEIVLLGLCYLYIVFVIVLTGKISYRLPKTLVRKFLHIMIGNFIFVIPLFSLNTFPVNFPFFVAAPFIFLTLLVSPLSPVKSIRFRLSGLVDITGGGHPFGLVFYAVSYTLLALFFSDKPYILAAGIIPLAYGDAAASLVGQKFGKHHYNGLGKKSLEGSIGMFMVCFLILFASYTFFGYPYALSMLNFAVASFSVAVVATVLEAITPKGLDNLTVPLCSAVVFLLLLGGI